MDESEAPRGKLLPMSLSLYRADQQEVPLPGVSPFHFTVVTALAYSSSFAQPLRQHSYSPWHRGSLQSRSTPSSSPPPALGCDRTKITPRRHTTEDDEGKQEDVDGRRKKEECGVRVMRLENERERSEAESRKEETAYV